MSLPSISTPTDNLYKFIAIFGLIMLVAGVVYLFYTMSSHLDKIEKRRMEALESAAKTGVKIEVNSDFEMVSRHALIQGAFVSVIGSAMVVFGFVNWYHRVQKFLDKQLVAETEKIVREASKA